LSKTYPNFSFNIIHKASSSGKARCGILSTPHGDVQTPAFIFCGTKAAIKGLDPKQMRDLGTQIILSNTYHLMLQPGPELVENMGGLQEFTGWRGPMLTDSGGYQIFSLGHGSISAELKGKRLSADRKTLMGITEEGARFKSYINGDIEFLTPERAMDIQKSLGADLIVTLDECTPFHASKAYTENSLEMTHRWEKRCLARFKETSTEKQAVYAVLQGGVHLDLRKRAAEFVNENDFWAHAVGGSLGSSKEQMYDIVGFTMEILSRDRPVHLLGIGGVSDIFNGVENGIDTFDCVHPTRLGRHGGALAKPNVKGSKSGRLNLNNAMHREDADPIDSECLCPTCKNHSRSYLHHLLKADEILAYILLTAHNVFFMNSLMSDIREAIKSDTLEKCKKLWY
jgi:queuine tRNA-ribosyltransferase